MLVVRISFLLLFFAIANGFVVPTLPALKTVAFKSCRPSARRAASQHSRFHTVPRMAMDEDELDRKLRELAAERKQSLDDVFGSSDKSKQRIEEARSAKIEAETADKARVGGSAEAASRGSKAENIVDSPSFLKQAVNSAQQQERDLAASVPKARPTASLDVEIDPRGFIVPKVVTPFIHPAAIPSIHRHYCLFHVV
jgi:hypothetical protein